MTGPLPDFALDQLFREARTFRTWLPEPVSTQMLRALYDLWKWAPTSHNSSPGRIAFAVSPQAKERLAACATDTNKTKVLAAPVTAIVAWDVAFHERFPELSPARGDVMRDRFAGAPALAHETAFRNSSLQGAYLMLAARALGLDCGPMSGFDNAAVDAAFFPDGRWRSNFICSLGFGDPEGLRPRQPRLAFEEACEIV